MNKKFKKKFFFLNWSSVPFVAFFFPTKIIKEQQTYRVFFKKTLQR